MLHHTIYHFPRLATGKATTPIKGTISCTFFLPSILKGKWRSSSLIGGPNIRIIIGANFQIQKNLYFVSSKHIVLCSKVIISSMDSLKATPTKTQLIRLPDPYWTYQWDCAEPVSFSSSSIWYQKLWKEEREGSSLPSLPRYQCQYSEFNPWHFTSERNCNAVFQALYSRNQECCH